MKITNCQVDHLKNPLGYQITKPDFSYVITDSKAEKQTTARIVIATDQELNNLIFDSGWTNEIDSLGYIADASLKPRTRYYWTVSARTDLDEEATSAVNWFETGKQHESWEAQWITSKQKTGRHPVFKKQITLTKPLVSARLYICGLGLYEAYLNQERIGNEFLTPYVNDYNSWLQYQTYDVTKQLKKDNELEVILGNGWYKGRFGYEPNSKENRYGDAWELIAEVRLTYADGSTAVIGTDSSWKVHYGPITASSIYDGQQVDMTLADTSEEQVLLSKRTTEKLADRYSTPVTIHEELKPIALIHTPAGETVLDIGQNQAGIFRLHVKEPKGTKIRLQFGEILQQGNFYNKNLRTAKQEFVYIADGQEKIIQPAFTYFGYRYVKVEGIPNLKKEDFTACSLYSRLPKIGEVKTGNKKINKLINNVEWGLKSNFIDMPTDCPQRDERMGWTGDAQIFSATASFYRDTYAFYQKYLHDILLEQQQADGRVPSMIPSFGDKATSSVWGDAACIIPWNVYLFSGDKKILADQFPSMKAWVDYIEKIDGNNLGWNKGFHFGDWLALDNKSDVKNDVMGATDVDFIVRVYYLISARLTAKTARILDKKDEAVHYEKLAQKILEYIRDEYYSPNGRCTINTQTALLMTLAFNLVEDKTKIITALAKAFEETGHQFTTGFVGTALLCNTLADNGFEKVAYDLLLNEEYPGWLYEINLGATTVWERWNSVLPTGEISSAGMNSLNHEAYGSIGEFIFRHVAGISPLEEAPGFRKVQIKPLLNWKIRQAEAKYNTAAGPYQIKWVLTDSTHVTLSVHVPLGCEALLTLPLAPEDIFTNNSNEIFNQVKDNECVLKPGTYKISYEITEDLHQVFSTYTPIRELFYNKKAKNLLIKNNPNILEIPLELREKSIRELSQAYIKANPEYAKQLDQLDLALKPLNE
ncbi:MAG: family 78 glycoside hydrolase catalytic domain [Liquorilactobacillus ghanensis]|uniref:alpha-L-rhamnosidase n=1 Tax=Liquorilactobacillus ghanensis TaxID=399370 RepID=UPI0039EAF3D2